MTAGKRKPARRKYRNQPTNIDGIRFDSKREAKRYAELLTLQKARMISGLKTQPRFPIEIGGVIVRHVSQRGATGVQVVYVADFQYRDLETGKTVIEDSKGVRTEGFKLKKAMMNAMGLEVIET